MRLAKLLNFTILALFIIFNMSGATSLEVTSQYDLQLAIDYAYQANIDTLIFSTSGGVYTHGIQGGAVTDTLHLAITKPLTIIAKEGLEERPIITNSDPNAELLDIIRVYDDFTVEGVIFDGGHEQSHGMKYALRMDNDETRGYFVNTDADLTVKDCIFRDIFEDKDLQKDGHVFKIAQVKAGTIKFEDCIIKNTGYEAIRISDTEKWATEKACDTLIVRNCTFENIDAECIRFYGDTDVETEDAPVLIENLTINNSATRVMFVKNNSGTRVRNIIITNSRLSGHVRDTDVIEIQLNSTISNIDTMNISTLTGTEAGIEIYVGKNEAKGVDKQTIWGFDPLYADAANGDYTLQPASHAYLSAHDGGAMGDLKWATETPTVIPFTYEITGKGMIDFSPELDGKCFDANTNVTVTAVPDSANEFVEWGGDLSGSDNPTSILVDAAKHITATFQTATAIGDEVNVVREFKLSQNYPNPFNPATTIEYSLPSHAQVTLQIFNLQGKLIQTLVKGNQNAGKYSINWRPSNVSSGVYIYRLEAGSKTDVRKLMFIK